MIKASIKLTTKKEPMLRIFIAASVHWLNNGKSANKSQIKEVK